MIAEGAFYGCSRLTSINIPNSVTNIGYSAFYGCSGLISITIPNSVTSIGKCAFRSCSSLTSITIPNSVTSIDEEAFNNCSGLISIEVESGNTKYDSRNNCNAIIETASNTLISGCKNTVIPNSVTSIGDWAFEGCSGLTSITIPNSVTSIGRSVFAGCKSLTSINISNSVTSIGDWAFSYCKGLTSINISNSVTMIAEGAFYGCSRLTSINIPNSVMIIGNNAFCECTSLNSVTIPNSVMHIGDGAFYNCSKLNTLTMYAPSCSLGVSAFNLTGALKNIYVFSDKMYYYRDATNWRDYAYKINAIDNVTVSGVTARQNPEITTDYWCTYYHPQANVKINTADVQMFKASLSGSNLTLTEVGGKVIKAGQAVVLKATAGGVLDMKLTSAASTGDFSGNELKGTSVEITGAAGNIYVLNAIAGKGAGFYKLKNEGTIGANKAYLTYDGVGAPEYFGFGETTSLSEELRAKSEEFATAPVYDLQGRRISQPVKGLYIVNGKKIVVK